jgi:hypothetical protein
MKGPYISADMFTQDFNAVTCHEEDTVDRFIHRLKSWMGGPMILTLIDATASRFDYLKHFSSMFSVEPYPNYPFTRIVPCDALQIKATPSPDNNDLKILSVLNLDGDRVHIHETNYELR